MSQPHLGRPLVPPHSERAPHRLAIADDHAIVRMGYRRLLEDEPDLRVIAEYGSADQAERDLLQRRPGEIELLILDLSMPGRSGLDLLRDLRTQLPELRVVIYTMHDTAALRAQCLRAGAADVVSKSDDPDLLVAAVRQVLSLVPPSPGPHSPAPSGHTGPWAPHDQLTPREHEALLLLLQGLSLEQVARTMAVSDKTVSNYQTQIRQKLGVSSALELLRYGQAHGLAP